MVEYSGVNKKVLEAKPVPLKRVLCAGGDDRRLQNGIFDKTIDQPNCCSHRQAAVAAEKRVETA